MRDFTAQELDDALEVAASGGSIADIARVLSMKPRQLAQYAKSVPIFGNAMKQARDLGFTVRAESLRETILYGNFADSNHMRVFVDTEKWLLGKLNPAVFGDRIAVQVEHVDVGLALKEARDRAKLIDVTPSKPAQLTDHCGLDDED